MINFYSTGSFKNTESFLNRMAKRSPFQKLERYAQMGTDALRNATPVDTGLAAQSWEHEVLYENGVYAIIWSNTNVENGASVVILIQYGHGTRDGNYIQGLDFINPAIKPVFEKILDEVWKEVTRG